MQQESEQESTVYQIQAIITSLTKGFNKEKLYGWFYANIYEYFFKFTNSFDLKYLNTHKFFKEI